MLDEIERFAAEGPSERKNLLRLRITSSATSRCGSNSSQKIARNLLQFQLDDLGIDYIERRNDLIRAVTVEDIRRVVQRAVERPFRWSPSAPPRRDGTPRWTQSEQPPVRALCRQMARRVIISDLPRSFPVVGLALGVPSAHDDREMTVVWGWEGVMKIKACVAALVVLFCSSFAVAGPVVDAATSAEALQAEGKTVEALDALDSAVDAIWSAARSLSARSCWSTLRLGTAFSRSALTKRSSRTRR